MMAQFDSSGTKVKTARCVTNNYFSNALTVTKAYELKMLDAVKSKCLHSIKSYQRSYAPTGRRAFGFKIRDVEISLFIIKGGYFNKPC